MLQKINSMPRLYLIHKTTPKYKVAYGVNTILVGLVKKAFSNIKTLTKPTNHFTYYPQAGLISGSRRIHFCPIRCQQIILLHKVCKLVDFSRGRRFLEDDDGAEPLHDVEAAQTRTMRPS